MWAVGWLALSARQQRHGCQWPGVKGLNARAKTRRVELTFCDCVLKSYRRAWNACARPVELHDLAAFGLGRAETLEDAFGLGYVILQVIGLQSMTTLLSALLR